MTRNDKLVDVRTRIKIFQTRLTHISLHVRRIEKFSRLLDVINRLYYVMKRVRSIERWRNKFGVRASTFFGIQFICQFHFLLICLTSINIHLWKQLSASAWVSLKWWCEMLKFFAWLINSTILIKQDHSDIARRAEDREVPGSSPTWD